MITIRGKVSDPCFVCQSKEKTANLKFSDGTFEGVLCMDHLYERIKPYVKKNNKSPKRSAGGKDPATKAGEAPPGKGS